MNLAVAVFSVTSFLYPGPYLADLVRVIDGDSLFANVYVWPGTFVTVNVRLDGINAPEIRTRSKCEKAAGLKAKRFLEEEIGGKYLTLKSVRRGKYAGRVLADVYAGQTNLGKLMLEKGLARPYSSGRRQPWCSDI